MQKLFSLILLFFTFSIFSITYKTEDINPIPLTLKNTKKNPMDQFKIWQNEANEKSGDIQSRIATLSTCSKDNIPTSRSMMVRILDNGEIAFFGNENSLKFKHLKENPNVSLLFYWYELQEEVVFNGTVKKAPRSLCEKVFKNRNRNAQIASHASKQGDLLKDRKILLNKHNTLSDKYKNKDVPTPDHWTGYILIPNEVFFLQIGPHTLHSRVKYFKENNKWKKNILHP